MKIGLMFSGQGAQQVDMGMDFYQSLPAYRNLIDQASQQLGYDLTEVAQDESKIKQTEFAQPAIVAMSLAIVQALGADLPKPAASVGLSLGEYSALAAAGAMSFDQVLAIIKDRGRYMQEVGDQNPGKMVAVMGDDQDLIVTTLKKLQERGLQVYPANFNTFAQLVIGGVAADVDQAVDELTAAGIKRMVELPVVGAFHTPLLNEAALRLQNRLADETFQPLLYPVYSNTTKQPFIIDQLKDTLRKQIVSPTYFAQDLQAMLDQGVDTLIEIGPAATLVKFAKKIAPKEVARHSITDLDSFREVQQMLSAGKE
ncbi:ACP S-malonyltransferase [Convivina praedatoris]|uniref:Malonyl CoA-acyl carrier protein transacylase n=1 Tax=Convivina praedatoris TaxID=2880963 RepID=A0ABN8H823_9LACO|nr:ACP S-malonyltransferase [Convivina sp. LMG 32447]CAH1851770.1 Malonyl CoA-acyl carrier protein transacylase [Convivina sp. LMG 32447]CAH1851796.1 Malonyl CoA-acyl carrier protein transacylase [Convivina sp. LMG 32447]CAH1853069.1 Malonyl CoA-acyl carrier protein transacylase [Convivina sp. LMG 32447]